MHRGLFPYHVVTLVSLRPAMVCFPRNFLEDSCRGKEKATTRTPYLNESGGAMSPFSCEEDKRLHAGLTGRTVRDLEVA